jgi:dimethylamine/trimethylamine dehydrogenase
MDKHTQASEEYLDTLLKYFEDEISGEAYFYGLAEHFAEREKTILLARVERHAAESVRPLLDKYGLEPRDETVIHNQGKGYVQKHQAYSWPEFMTYIIKRYPGYLDEFKGLEDMAPREDLPALNILTDHEVAVIEFAKMELAGNPDSLLPLIRYLA